jgi:hypothetical protein
LGSPIFYHPVLMIGARGSVMIKALCYKPEGDGFYTPWADFFKFM